MIILLTMLYAMLASGGYLDNFSSWESIGSYLNFQNSDATTPGTITIEPIHKEVSIVRNKVNSRKATRYRNFNYKHQSSKNPVRVRIPNRLKSNTTKAIKKTKLKSKTVVPSTTKTHLTTTTVGIIPQYNDTIETVELEDQDIIQNLDITEDMFEIPQQSSHLTKYIESCPPEGYFFKRDQYALEPACYLCFCKENNTSAVCWPRDSQRCDDESYQHNLKRRRSRRSFDFGNLFMKDAARDALNANGKKQCKPGEPSYSVGCPPDDWCVGCTVCDCDINAKWNCHLLSFCTDDKTKQNKKAPQTQRPYDPFTTPKARRAQRKLAQQAIQRLTDQMQEAKKKKRIGNDNSGRYFFKNGTLVNKTIFDLRKRKKSPSIFNQSSSEIQKFVDVNLKIRKIPDQIEQQMMIDRQNNNAKKVSESANLLVRNMPNSKLKQRIEQNKAQAVNMLAKREPTRKKKRQVILPSGYKLPKEILDKLPKGVIPPSREFPGASETTKIENVKKTLLNKKTFHSIKKDSRKSTAIEKKIPQNSFQLASDDRKRVLVKRSTKLENVSQYNTTKKRTNNKEDKERILRQESKNYMLNKLKGKTILNRKSSAQNVNLTIPQKRYFKTIKKNNDQHISKTQSYSVSKTNMARNKKQQNNKVTKVHTNNKFVVKKTVNNEKEFKKSITYNRKRSIITSTTDKNLKHNKPLTNFGKKSKRKSMNARGPIVMNSRDRVKVMSSTETNTIAMDTAVINTTEKIRTPNPSKVKTIDQKRLNAEIKKITINMQTNLNRKVLELVGKMVENNLNNESKKVKRSVFIDQSHFQGKFLDENVISDSSIEFPKPVPTEPTRNENKTDESDDLSIFQEEEKVFGLPFIVFSGQKVKRFAKINETYSKRQSITNVSSPTLQINDKFNYTAHNRIKREDNHSDLIDIFVPTEFKNELTPNIRKNNRPSRTPKEVFIKQKSQSNKKNGPPSYIYIKKSPISINKFNKVNVKRNKRAIKYDNLSSKTDSKYIKKEMSINKFPVMHLAIPRKSKSTESVFNYYKYALDGSSLVSSVKETEEPYTKKTIAAKRSVDKHVQSLNVDALQMSENISIQGLRRNHEHFTSEQVNENHPFLNYTESHTVHPKLLNILESSKILDDKVVIIEDQNKIRSDKFISNSSFINLNTENDSKSNLLDLTVIGVKENINKSMKNTKDIYKETTKKSFDTVVDTSIVIISDQNNTISTSHTPYSPKKKYNMELDKITTTNSALLLVNQSISESTINSIENEESPTSLTSTTQSLKLISTTTEYDTENNTHETIILSHDKLNNNVNVRGNKYKPQENLSVLGVQIKSTIPSIQNYVTNSQNTNTTLKITPEEMERVITTPKNKYLKYEVEIKTSNLSTISTNQIERKNLIKPDMIFSKNQSVVSLSTAPPKDLSVVMNYNEMDNRVDFTVQNLQNSTSIVVTAIDSDLERSSTINYANIHSSEELITQIEDNVKNNVSQNFIINYNKTDINYTVQDLQTPSFAATIAIDLDSANSTTTVSYTNYTNNCTSQIVEKYITQFSDSVYQRKVSPLPQEVKCNQTKQSHQRNKIKSNQVKKLSNAKGRAQKIKKLLSTIFNKKNEQERQLVKDNRDANNMPNKTSNQNSFIKRLLRAYTNNKHARKLSDFKILKILKYLKKVFKKIFVEDKNHEKNNTIVTKINRKSVIEILCASFGPCNSNITNKAKFQSQLDHLNLETYKMLRSIRIIKGLLRQTNLSSNDKIQPNQSNKMKFNKDIQKLHSILIDTNGKQFENLTNSQKLQIMCIKNNTQYFISAASKFATVLNNIINVITTTNSNSQDKQDIKFKPTIEMNNLNGTNKLIKLRNPNNTKILLKPNESLQKLKALIAKYNFMQNAFMRKINNVIKNLDSAKEILDNKEDNLTNSTVATKTNVQIKTEEIQMYAKNIIQNLRKLKNLAHDLNGNLRRKRDLRYDDSLEYLLLLMEYLLKKKHPDVTPMNDGIDILLDAIKNAPDIKEIKLEIPRTYTYSVPEKNMVQRSKPVRFVSSEVTRPNDFKENFSGKENKSSEEDNNTSANSDIIKANVFDKSFGDDVEGNMLSIGQYPLPVKEVTTSAIGTSNTDTTSNTTKYISVFSLPTSTVKEINESKIKGGSRNDDFLNKYVDYEIENVNTVTEFQYTSTLPSETISTTATTTTSTTTTSTTTTTITAANPNSKVDDNISDKSRLDWIDEAYEEIKENSSATRNFKTSENSEEIRPKIIKKNKKIAITTTEQTSRSNEVSNLSKENDKPLKRRNNSKEILYKKNLDLLNSLDYGPSKVEADVSGSKESGMIDKYSGDTFARFV